MGPNNGELRWLEGKAVNMVAVEEEEKKTEKKDVQWIVTEDLAKDTASSGLSMKQLLECNTSSIDVHHAPDMGRSEANNS